MLEIIIPGVEFYNAETNEFIETPQTPLKLEHSLVSLSKWESKWHKPFLGQDDKSSEEIIDYIKCMTITQNVNPNVYLGLTQPIIQKICDYIADPMTATTFHTHGSDKFEASAKGSGEIITSEVIYYWMVALQIPPEYQKWHLNRLLTLIRVCNIKNQPPKKMGRKEVMNQHVSLNEARRAAAGI